MNFETISRFHFKPIEKEMRSVQETFRIGATQLSMTQAMYERMDKPQYLCFAYDAEERAVGIKITDADDHSGIPVNTNKKTNAVYMNNSKYVCNKIAGEMKVDLAEKSIILRRGYVADGWYVFELRYADVVKKSGKKKETK